MRYLNGYHFAWVCEYFDARKAPSGSAAAMIAPSSNPCRIYRNLREDQHDDHSQMIRDYRKTFIRLAHDWLARGVISKNQRDEIIAEVRSRTGLIWRPVLYVIPREPIERAGRLVQVRRSARAAHGPELQITDLHRDEFDIIELDIV